MLRSAKRARSPRVKVHSSKLGDKSEQDRNEKSFIESIKYRNTSGEMWLKSIVVSASGVTLTRDSPFRSIYMGTVLFPGSLTKSSRHPTVFKDLDNENLIERKLNQTRGKMQASENKYWLATGREASDKPSKFVQEE